jgi:SNF2 family DNA or RNA helicase
MGKTIEAILVLRRLLAGRGVRRVLILLPAGLQIQWQQELREKGGLVFPKKRSFWPLSWLSRFPCARRLWQPNHPVKLN